jgi:hypothetical protein
MFCGKHKKRIAELAAELAAARTRVESQERERDAAEKARRAAEENLALLNGELDRSRRI